MKTIRFTAISILLGLLVLVSACKKETNPATDTQSGSKISVTGQDAGIGLKSTLNNQTTVWIAGSDKVGIYSPQARTQTAGTGSAIVNAPFTAATSAASSTFTGTMYWGAASTSHTFYAYYPYAAGSAASTAVPVSLATAQTQSAANNSDHIGALDFMVATPTTVTSPANTNAVANEVNIRYNHLFTILEFQIKGTGPLKAVKLVGTSNPIAFSGGTIDITQTTPATDVAYTLASQTGTTTQAVVTLTSAATLTAINTDTKVYMVINPGTQIGNCLIGLSADGTNWTYISKAAPTGGFLRGRKYVVTINQADAGAAPSGSPIDSDGNAYRIVTIGTQVWMAENLKTTKYNDGTAIPNVTDNATWGGLSTGAYCDYNNNSSNSTTYGKLYNWYAVDNNASTKMASNGGRNICPVGWHVPNDAEWTTLITYLGGESAAGGKLKESGTTHWTTPNFGATNETGFTALPGGYRNWDGWSFSEMGTSGRWWSSSPNFTNADFVVMYNFDSSCKIYLAMRTFGFSVRCIRD